MNLRRRVIRAAAGPADVGLSPGAWVILLIAVVSTVLVVLRPTPERSGLVMWTRARNHLLIYEPMVAAWNADAGADRQVQLYLMSDQALERRMLSGFLSEVPVADLIEIERNMAGRVFSGPLDDVGFVDLTDRLREEGLYEQINEPSYGPWTSRGADLRFAARRAPDPAGVPGGPGGGSRLGRFGD